MATTPIDVPFRPFAIEPVTRIMLPDGIFDNAIYNLRIAAHFTNSSGTDLTNVTIYLESVGDPGIAPLARTHKFAKILAGSSVMVWWDADFEHATPGKRLVSFVARADGFDPHRVIQQIFVSQTRFDPVLDQYVCTVEEGTLAISSMRVIGPRPTWGKDGECHNAPPWGPFVPTGLTGEWTPNPAYAGTHADLPFSDPWWKILAIIIAIIAAIVAIVAAATGGGTASFGVSGTFEETEPSVSCCTPDTGAGPKRDYTVAGVASAIATGAAAVALSDDADPWWRGQEATPPPNGGLTVGERVEASWKLAAAPNAGEAYTADVEWTYTRHTTAGTQTHSVSETQTNIHVAENVVVTVPATVGMWDKLWVQSTFTKPGGSPFVGPDLYAFAVLRSPGGLYFVIDLTDDGLDFDPGANDGVYAGYLHLEDVYKILLRYDEDPRGRWGVYVYAQDIDQTRPGTEPHIAAQEIGGFFVASAVTLTFDPTLPCPLKAHASVEVI